MTNVIPEEVRLWGWSNTAPGSYLRTMPLAGSGFVDARGIAVDQTAGAYPFLSTPDGDASYVASYGGDVGTGGGNGDSSAWQQIVARFPAVATGPTDAAFTVQWRITDTSEETVRRTQFLQLYTWSTIASAVGPGSSTFPFAPSWSNGLLLDAFPPSPWPDGWQTIRSRATLPTEALDLLAVGDLALVITNQYNPPAYSFRVSYVSLGPAITPPLRQRQRSDGLAASGAPRQHQRATLQTSIRQRAIR